MPAHFTKSRLPGKRPSSTASVRLPAQMGSVDNTDGATYRRKILRQHSGQLFGGSVFYSLDVGLKPLVNLVAWTAKVGKTVEILGQGFTGATEFRSTESRRNSTISPILT